jgi:hypothetical protein
VTEHTTPLVMGAMRLLPGGLALVGWASAAGRPQPSSPAAWAWIAAFALVDGAMFQASARAFAGRRGATPLSFRGSFGGSGWLALIARAKGQGFPMGGGARARWGAGVAFSSSQTLVCLV